MNRHTTSRSGRLASTCPIAQRLVRDAVREVRAAVPVMSMAESQNLSDLADGRGWTMVVRALDTASRAENDAAALAIVDALARYIFTRRADRHPVSAVELLREETSANAEANAAEIEYLASPCPANLERLIAAHRRQRLASARIVRLVALPEGFAS